MTYEVTVTEQVTEITTTDDVTSITITETPAVISEQVAGIQGAKGDTGATGATGATGVVAADAPITYNSTTKTVGITQSAISIAPSQVTGTAVITTDSRLSDARTPTAHANSHKVTGSDTLALDGSQITTGTILKDRIPTLNQNTTGTAAGLSQSLAVAFGGTGSPYGSLVVGHAQLNATRTKAGNTTTPEAVFWDSGASAAQYFAVDADTNYFFEGLLQLNKSATATAALPIMSLIYVASGSTSTLTEQSARLVARSDSTGTANIGIISGSAANSSFTSTGTGSTAATTYFLRFYGFIRTNATTAGRINLGLAQSVVGSSVAPDFVNGSYMNIYKVGTGAASNFGNWTA